jgi:hypothetical protein
MLDETRAAAEATHARQHKITVAMLIVSLACFPAIAFIYADAEAGVGVLSILLILFVMLAFRVIFGVIGAFILSATVVGGMGFLGEAVLKLTAIYAVTTVTGYALAPLGFFSRIINLILFVGLVQWLFDLEGGEAWIFAIITGLLGIVGAFIAVMLLGSL